MSSTEHMKLSEVKDLLSAKVITSHCDMQTDILRAYCADLMSDVLTFSIANSLLLTHLTNAQVIRTSYVSNFKAIVFVEGKRPNAETIALAEGKGIPLMVTDMSMFDACGLLYEKGLRGRAKGEPA